MDNKSLSVFAVLYRRTNHGKLQILLIEDVDTRGRWKLAGGKSEEGESPKRALSRELHQELAIAVDERSIDKLVYHMPLRTHAFMAFAFPFSKRFGAIHMNADELLRVHWFDLKEVEHLLRYGKVLPHHTTALLDFIAWQES